MPDRQDGNAGPGTLVPVVGPSGVGKDTLIACCRARLAGDDTIVFPRRTITRPAGDASEDHVAVTEAAFRAQAAGGAFAFHWQAHGLFYGVPAAIDADIAARRTVVVNVSRSVIGLIRKRYRRVTVVSVEARADAVADRLAGRGRETAAEIDRRLARAAIAIDGPDVVVIDNSGPVADACETLLRLLVGVDSQRAAGLGRTDDERPG